MITIHHDRLIHLSSCSPRITTKVSNEAVTKKVPRTKHPKYPRCCWPGGKRSGTTLHINNGDKANIAEGCHFKGAVSLTWNRRICQFQAHKPQRYCKRNENSKNSKNQVRLAKQLGHCFDENAIIVTGVESTCNTAGQILGIKLEKGTTACCCEQ